MMLESQGRAPHTHLQMAHAASTDRERSRDVGNSRIHDALLERIRLGMAATQRQAAEGRERLGREVRESDAQYAADAHQ